MSKSKRQRTASQPSRRNRIGDGRKPRPELPASAPVSLPLPEAGQALSIPVSLSQTDLIAQLVRCTRCGTKFLRKRDTCSICGELHPEKAAVPEHARLSDDSPVRKTALQIYAMRAAGLTDQQIADALQLSVKTIPGYIYKAGKNGWLTFDDPKDSLEYQILHKVVRNIDEMLDSPDEEVKKEVTLKTAEGTLFKKFNDPGQAAGPTTIVGVKIEVVGGEKPQVREGTIMGTGTYIDAESVPVE